MPFVIVEAVLANGCNLFGSLERSDSFQTDEWIEKTQPTTKQLRLHSLKLTASLPLKIGGPQNETIVFQPYILRGYLSFKERNTSWPIYRSLVVHPILLFFGGSDNDMPVSPQLGTLATS